MKKFYLLALVFSFGIHSNVYSQHAFLEQGLINKLTTAESDELIPILMEMDDVVDVEALKADFISRKVPVKKRAELLMQQLKAKANATQPAVISFIENSGLEHTNVQQFWIANLISLEASPELIANLADLESVGRIGLNTPQYSLIQPKKGTGSLDKTVGGVEPGLIAIGAPEMWAMGYTGQSRLALTFDTGAWPDHPAFKNRYLVNRMPLAQTWFGYDSPVPVDKSDGHGTHVSGTMLGLDTATADTIGSAMGAYLIATDPVVQNLAYVKPLSEFILGYQWALNPDGDESTSDDVPDVINNSWGRDNTVVDQDWTVCPEFWVPVMNAVEAAGIANVFSAGNDGPGPHTIGIPHNTNTGLVNSFTVGAVDANNPFSFPIATFSSRGPSLCGGDSSLLIKPEVSAPGVNVRSSVGGGEYDVYSGTSMASPHVSGAVLLLKEAFPYLSGEDILLGLYYSATDLGTPGEDNTYGMGMINVKDAYDYLAETNDPVPPAVHNTDLELLSILSPNADIGCGQAFGPTTINPVVVVRNNGTNAITGINIHATVNGDNETIFNDDALVLPAGSDTQIDLSAIEFSETGDLELHIWITPLEDEFDKFNNHNVFRWKQLPAVEGGYFYENFESGIDSSIWTIRNPDGGITWDTLSVIQANGQPGVAAWMDFRNYNLVASQHDDLISPMLSTDAIDVTFTNVLVSFDLFYRKKSDNVYLQDTLAIFINQQCGGEDEQVSEVFRAGGEDLYTVSESSGLPESAADWQHLEFLIPGVSSDTPYHYYVTFEGINRRGNHLLIDNVNIESSGVGVKEIKGPEFDLFPNPTTNSFTVKYASNQNAKTLSIYDIFGRKLAEHSEFSNKQFDVSAFAKGVYLVRINWKNGLSSASHLVIQ